jgi:hypothetical protein
MKRRLLKAKKAIRTESVKQISVMLLSLLVSIIIAFVPDWYKTSTFTNADQIILGFLSFGTFLLIDMVWLTYDYTRLKKDDVEHWEMRQDSDTDLANIRANFHKIYQEAYSKNDLFISHFRKEIQELSMNIKEVAEKQELYISADHFLSVENVLDAFEGDSERIWRYTWPIDATDEALFDPLHWKQYFEVTIKMLNQGKMNKIQCILLLKEPQIINSPRIIKLLNFFKATPSMDCRISTQKKYEEICASDGFAINSKEFGIYSSQLLYINEQYQPVIRGIFTKDPNRIQAYRKLFNTMWTLESVSDENPSKQSNKISLAELFNFDENPI